MRILVPTLCLSLLFSFCGSASSHEFWIEPKRYQIEPGQPIIADIRVGDKFKGPTNSYIKEEFTRFDITQAGKTVPVDGRLGDVPALKMTMPTPGLAIVAHETTSSTVRYYKWAKFSRFVHHKGFPEVLEQHKARGLPDTHFMERYSRHVKSLVAIGHGKGADAKMGLKTEFVAEANPYTDALVTGLPVRLFYEGNPRANAQVEVFARTSDGTVKISLLKTDAEGRAIIPVSPATEYLLDAVVIEPLDAEDASAKPVWETFWAGMTFKIPAK